MGMGGGKMKEAIPPLSPSFPSLSLSSHPPSIPCFLPSSPCVYLCSLSPSLCLLYAEESDRLADLLVKIVEDNSKGCYFSVDASCSFLDTQRLAAQFKDAYKLLKQAFLKDKS